MTQTDIAISAVCKVNEISRMRLFSSSRIYPCMESRMMLVALLSHIGQTDLLISMRLKRHRTSILYLRHRAEDMLSTNAIFKNKFNLALELYNVRYAESIRKFTT